uniref:cell wall integrity and stress response component 1-like n=1 Tax=Monopterus albus TaxID=43700 RepID=UPI0009B37FA1|nr:cell wall integrity and stress response component 1-like [Monopterus albus]
MSFLQRLESVVPGTVKRAAVGHVHRLALVHEVDIKQVGNRIHCSSEGIYPEPELTWSTRPPSTVTFENTTTVQQTEQRLYSISSSLIVSDSVTSLDYICTVSTHTNRRTATVFKRSPISTADSETTIQCTSTNSPLTGLVWRFNHSQTILTQTGPDALVNVSEGWEHHVKSVSESGSLTLQKLSSNHEGVYTCELSGAAPTTVTSTFLRIDTETSHNRGAIVGGVIGFVVLVLVPVVVCLLYWYFKRQKGKSIFCLHLFIYLVSLFYIGNIRLQA